MLTLDSDCCTAGVHVHSNHLVQAVVFSFSTLCGYMYVCVVGARGGGGGGGGHEYHIFCGGWGWGCVLLLTRTQTDCVDSKIVAIMIV